MLISVTQRFAEAFHSGKKTVEVRRRRLHVEAGIRIWIYAKLPIGRVELVGRVNKVATGSPTHLWRKYGTQTGLTRMEYFAYLANCTEACVIVIDDIKALTEPPTLAGLRKLKAGFQPPQFARFLESSDAIYQLLLTTNAVALT